MSFKKSNFRFKNPGQLDLFQGEPMNVAVDIEAIADYNQNYIPYEIAAVNDRGTIVFHTYIRDAKKIINHNSYNQKTLARKGVTEDMIAEGLTLEQVKLRLTPTFKKNRIIGHSINSDEKKMPALYGKARQLVCTKVRMNHVRPGDIITVNGHQVCKWQNLESCLQEFGIPFKGTPHTAVYDALATMQLYKKLNHEMKRIYSNTPNRSVCWDGDIT